MTLKKRTARIISALAIALLVVVQGAPAWALTAPTAPTAPEAPSAPENTTEAPTAPEAPLAPEAPTAPDSPTFPDSTQTTTQDPWTSQSQADEDDDEDDEDERPRTRSQTDSGSTSGDTGTTGTQSTGNQTGGQTDNGNLGDTTITTGGATNTATLATSANNNLGSTCATCGSGGATVVNSGNGDGSTNSGSATITNDTTTNQNNTAVVTNNLTQDSNTGNNSASRNTGGNSTITTGDANTTGTLITAVNTNIDAVAVAEFNVVDDHVGNIVLDFAADCISGCGSAGSTTVINSGNGADSTNTGSIDQTNTDATFQTNDATVENTMTLNANSGDNQTDRNTGGNSTITTGDANVSATSLTFANNNISGGVYYYVVNIFGDLVGDIIFPEEMLAYGACCGGDLTAINSGNGDGSTNLADINLTNTNTSFQTNVANIQNNLVLDATTGENLTSRNTNGTNSITTGNASVDAQVLNVANSNLVGGTWWLVIVNEAGQWIGRLFGGDGTNYAGSAGTEFTMNSAGEITAVNSGNGSGSTNTTDINQTNTTTTVQTDTANITNTLNLSANTGGNSASRNTGGDSSITTGDASIVANLVNFVNNNIIGGGKLFVSVVNVFGSWIGDFLPPGFSKPDSQALADASNESGIGGPEDSSESHGEAEENGDENSSEEESEESTAEEESQEGNIGPEGASTEFAYFSLAGSSVEAAGIDEVAGSALPQNTNGANVVNLNLAWLLLLLPFAGLLAIAKRALGLIR